MTPGVVGAVLGCMLGVGVLLVGLHLEAVRRPRLEARLAPYLRDLPHAHGPTRAHGVDGPATARRLLEAAAARLGLMLGGARSAQRRLQRAGSAMSVQQFRMEQVLWGCVGFGIAAAVTALLAMQGRGEPVAFALLCGASAVAGVVWRDVRLSAGVHRRERRLVAEFPALADLLALAVTAGEGPVGAIERILRVGHGELAAELSVVLADARTGCSLPEALDRLASRTGVPAVARFAEAFAVAVERGTPLADVLHAQAADVREASRRELIETGARREVLMLVPVVFLVLPVTVIFAFWPGVLGLRLMTP